MPRTVIVLQTAKEPTSAEVKVYLRALFEEDARLLHDPPGIIEAHVIAPKPDGGSLQISATP